MSTNFRSAMENANVSALWERHGRGELTEGPHLWRWADVYPRLFEASDIVDLEDGAERRSGRSRIPAAFGLAYSSVRCKIAQPRQQPTM